MTDNGQPKQAPRNLPLRGSKLTPFEGGTRVPMIMRWPKNALGGGRSSTPIMIEDFMPTVLGAAQIQMPADLPQTVDGQKFLPLTQSSKSWLQGPSSPQYIQNKLSNRALIWHFPHTYDGPPFGAIRRGDWKLIYWYANDSVELYNLVDDIGEANDLSSEQPERAAELLKRLKSTLKRRGALLPDCGESGGQ